MPYSPLFQASTSQLSTMSFSLYCAQTSPIPLNQSLPDHLHDTPPLAVHVLEAQHSSPAPQAAALLLRLHLAHGMQQRLEAALLGLQLGIGEAPEAQRGEAADVRPAVLVAEEHRPQLLRAMKMVPELDV